MPRIDLPLEELETYRGSSPLPADFDAYWDRALAEAAGVDPRAELVPASFSAPFAECFDLWFTGVRGARIHAKFLRPAASRSPAPALLRFHGYQANCGDWVSKLSYVAAGFVVAAMDCRGQGGLSEDTGGVKGNTHNGHVIRGLDDESDNMLMRHIFLDTVVLARVVMGMEEVDATRVGTYGGSQGGALAIACAALESRIRRLAPFYPFLCDYKRVWDMDLAKDAYGELAAYFRLFDPRHEREDAVFERLGYIDLQNLAPRIRGDVLMATGLMDTLCPPSTQFAMYNKIRANKRLVLYPDFAHEVLPGFDDMTFSFFSELR